MLEAQINLNGPDCELLFTTHAAVSDASEPYRDLWKPA